MCACSGESVKFSWAPMYSPRTMPLNSSSPPVTKKAADTRGMTPLIVAPRHRMRLASDFREATLVFQGAEHVLESSVECLVHFRHRGVHAEIGQAGDAMPVHP